MRVNHNIPALRAYNSVNQSSRAVSASMEKLASGNKINSAKDDAAGLAISNKMRTQIRALEMANRNSMDGISLVQTADGALTEVHAMLQRMRELAVQGGTDSVSPEDREKIQTEIDQLLSEINDVSYKAEFNTKRLFGPKNRFSVVDGAGLLNDATSISNVSANFPSGTLSYTIAQLGIQGQFDLDFTNTTGASGSTLTIDGSSQPLTFTSDDKETCIKEALSYAEGLGYEVIRTGDKLEIYSGNKAINSIPFNGTVSGGPITNASVTNGQNPALSALPSFTDKNGMAITVSGMTVVSANQIEVTLGTNPASTVVIDINQMGLTPLISQSATIREESFGDFILQTGANQYMEMSVKMPEISIASLGIDTLKETGYLAIANTNEAIELCDAAIATISNARSNLGAYQNRLEHTVTGLDITTENTATALSRIADTDMAKEMTKYTSQSVVNQAAMSIMAQANQRPQQILQLIGNN